MKKAIFPGSFNLMHQGHINTIKKALNLFDFIYVIITVNPDKEQYDNFEERLKIAQESLKHLSNVEIIINKNELTAEIAKKLNVNFLIRSARNNFDFEYETQLAEGNKNINNNLETIIFFPDNDSISFSSTLERHKKFLEKRNN